MEMPSPRDSQITICQQYRFGRSLGDVHRVRTKGIANHSLTMHRTLFNASSLGDTDSLCARSSCQPNHVYMLHHWKCCLNPPPDLDLVPLFFWYCQALVAEGKVQYVGLSEVTADDIRRAHAITPISAVELEWSLFTRDVEVSGCRPGTVDMFMDGSFTRAQVVAVGWCHPERY